jgi:hypothetical protein
MAPHTGLMFAIRPYSSAISGALVRIRVAAAAKVIEPADDDPLHITDILQSDRKRQRQVAHGRPVLHSLHMRTKIMFA